MQFSSECFRGSSPICKFIEIYLGVGLLEWIVWGLLQANASMNQSKKASKTLLQPRQAQGKKVSLEEAGRI